MFGWDVALGRAVGLLWLCLAQTGEAGESFDFFGFVILILKYFDIETER